MLDSCLLLRSGMVFFWHGVMPCRPCLWSRLGLRRGAQPGEEWAAAVWVQGVGNCLERQ